MVFAFGEIEAPKEVSSRVEFTHLASHVIAEPPRVPYKVRKCRAKNARRLAKRKAFEFELELARQQAVAAKSRAKKQLREKTAKRRAEKQARKAKVASAAQARAQDWFERAYYACQLPFWQEKTLPSFETELQQFVRAQRRFRNRFSFGWSFPLQNKFSVLPEENIIWARKDEWDEKWTVSLKQLTMIPEKYRKSTQGIVAVDGQLKCSLEIAKYSWAEVLQLLPRLEWEDSMRFFGWNTGLVNARADFQLRQFFDKDGKFIIPSIGGERIFKLERLPKMSREQKKALRDLIQFEDWANEDDAFLEAEYNRVRRDWAELLYDIGGESFQRCRTMRHRRQCSRNTSCVCGRCVRHCMAKECHAGTSEYNVRLQRKFQQALEAVRHEKYRPERAHFRRVPVEFTEEDGVVSRFQRQLEAWDIGHDMNNARFWARHRRMRRLQREHEERRRREEQAFPADYNRIPDIAREPGVQWTREALIERLQELEKQGGVFRGEAQGLMDSHINMTHTIDRSLINDFLAPIYESVAPAVRDKVQSWVNDFIHLAVLVFTSKGNWVTVGSAISWFVSLHAEHFSVSKIIASVSDWWNKPTGEAQADSGAIEDHLRWLPHICALGITLLGVLTVHKLPGKQDVNEFFTRFSRVGQMIRSFQELITQGSSLGEFLADTFRRWFLGYSSVDLDGWLSINRWCDEVMRLNNSSLEARLQTDDSLKAKLDSLVVEGDQIIHKLDAAKVPSPQRARVQNCWLFLRDAVTLSRSYDPGLTAPRPAPAVVHIYGDTGTGKSTSLPFLQAKVLHALGCRDTKDLGDKVYYRYPGNEFWDGYRNGVKIVVCDDFGSLKDSPQKPNPEALEAIRMSNTAFWSLPMAHLLNKGTTKFDANLVLWTSNRSTFVFNSLTNPEAVQSRVNLKFRQRPAPEYMVERQIDGKTYQCLDRARVAREAAEDDSVYTRCIVFDKMEVNYKADVVLQAGMTFDQVADEVSELTITMRDRGEQVNEHVARYFEMLNVPRFNAQANDDEGFAEMNAAEEQAARREFVGDIPPEALTLDRVPAPICYKAERSWSDLIWGTNYHVNVRLTTAGRGMINLESEPDTSQEGSAYRWASLARAHCIRVSTGTLCSQKLAAVLRLARTALRFAPRDGELAFCTVFNRYYGHCRIEDFLACEAHHDESVDEPLWYEHVRVIGKTATWFERLWRKIKRGLLAFFNKMEQFPVVSIVAMFGLTTLVSNWVYNKTYDRIHERRDKLRFPEKLPDLKIKFIDENSPEYPEYQQWRKDWDEKMKSKKFREAHYKWEDRKAEEFRRLATPEQKRLAQQFVRAESSAERSQAAPRNTVESRAENTQTAQRLKVESTADRTVSAQQLRVESAQNATVAAARREVEGENSAEVQAVNDQNSFEVSKNCASNTYVLEAFNNGEWFHCLNITIIGGRIAMANRHLLSFPYKRWRIRNFFFPQGFEFELDSCRAALPDENGPHSMKDTFLFELPRTVHLHKSIVKYFMTSEDLSRHRTLEGGALQGAALWRFKQDLEVPGMTYSTTNVVKAVDREYFELTLNGQIVGRVRDFYFHGIPTVKGDCGSLFFAIDSNFTRKIIGIHCAAAPAPYTGTVTPTTQEFIEHLLSKLDVEFKESLIPTNIQANHPMPVQVEGEEVTFERFEGFYPIGKNDLGQYAPRESQIRPSPVNGMITEPKTKPAYLHPIWVSGKKVDPEALGRSKAAGFGAATDKSILDACVNDVRQMVCRNINPANQRVLTFEESIMGVDGNEYIQPVNRRSSPGYGWKKIGKGKTHYLGAGEYVLDHPEVLATHASMKATVLRGERPCVIWSDTLKDERRPIAKVNQGKTRLFAAGEMCFTLLFRQYFAGFCAHMAENRIEMESCVGVNPYSKDWDFLARRLQQVGPHVIAGDFTNYDGSLNVDFLWALLDEVIEPFYQGTPEDRLARRAIWCEIVNSIHISGHTLYMWTHSQPSGCPATAIINSVYHSISARYAWLVVAKQRAPEFATLSAFRRYVRHVNYGDDDVWNIHPDVISWFNQVTITEAYATFGMTYTDEAKTGELVECRSLQEVNFLKRAFRWDDKAVRYRAPLVEDTILEMAMWTKGTLDQWSVVAATLEMAAYEAAQYSEAEFLALTAKLEQARRVTNEIVDCRFLTYAEYQEREWQKYVIGVV